MALRGEQWRIENYAAEQGLVSMMSLGRGQTERAVVAKCSAGIASQSQIFMQSGDVKL